MNTDRFNRAFSGWVRVRLLSDEVLSRCLGMTHSRLSELCGDSLPEIREIERIATAMDWPAERIAHLVELDRCDRDTCAMTGIS